MPNVRKELCAEGLIATVRKSLAIDDIRSRISIPIKDYIMSGFAMFSLKYPSLLAFDNARKNVAIKENLKSLYGIEQVPSDTGMREVLDQCNPEILRDSFKAVFNLLQRGKVLDRFRFLDDFYLIAADGTGYFSSHEIYCDSCLVKESKKTGKTTYQHQIMGAVLIHPDERCVLPFFPEPIVKQDGNDKNDCERNAAARLFEKIRKDHPKLKIIVTEDGLSSNAPHIKLLKNLNCSYILGAKPGDHKYLFEEIHFRNQDCTTLTDKYNDNICKIKFLNGISLNESNPDLLVNFIECREYSKKGERVFSWVTDINITVNNAMEIIKGGRARWKIENETFNTLKNQGYELEHNYGHGYKHLSTFLATLMFLAFFVDQTQMLACKLFNQAREKYHSNRAFWEGIKSRFILIKLPNWTSLFHIIVEEVVIDFMWNTS